MLGGGLWPNNGEKIDVLISLGLCLLTGITRIPFTSKFLYEWDSVQYALAFEKYDISHHQPHPPGYILFVALGKVINILFNDANTTIVFISIVFSILTTLLVYFLAKQMFSRNVAISSSLLLIFNPIFWFYGEVATIYASEAFLATLVAYLSYQVFRGKEKKFLYLSTLALGLAGGFRQDIIVFMFPLWLFCLFYHNRALKRIISVFALLLTSILVWYIPMITLTGGFEKYSSLSKGQLIGSFRSTSIFFGASIFDQIQNDIMLFSWSIVGLSFFGFLIIVLFFLYHHKTKSLFELLKLTKNLKSIFFILWIMPSFLFYLLIYVAKPGYILVYLPALTIIVGCIFTIFSSDLNTKFKTISSHSFLICIILLSIIFNTVYFLYPCSIREEMGGNIRFHELKTVSQKALLGLDSCFIYNNEKIRLENRNTELYLDAILNISHSDPNSTLIVLREGLDFRKTVYYLPDRNVYYLRDFENTGIKGNVSAWLGKNNTWTTATGKVVKIPINTSTEKVAWLINDKSSFFKELESKIEIENVSLSTGSKLYYSDVKNQNINFSVNGFIFKTE